MRRFQNYLLIAWTLMLLLFLAFNWALVQTVVDFEFLFMPFQGALLWWFWWAGLVAPWVGLSLKAMQSRGSNRRAGELEASLAEAQAEVERLKAVEHPLTKTEMESLLTQWSQGQLPAPQDSNAAEAGSPVESPEKASV